MGHAQRLSGGDVHIARDHHQVDGLLPLDVLLDETFDLGVTVEEPCLGSMFQGTCITGPHMEGHAWELLSLWYSPTPITVMVSPELRCLQAGSPRVFLRCLEDQ